MPPYSPRNNFSPIQPNVLDVFRGKYFLPILKEEVIRKKKKIPFQKRGSLERAKIKCLPPNIQIMYGSDIKTLSGANSHL
jgi:hypothetical protein